MEYYELSMDKRYANAPKIKNWFGILNEEYICKEKSYLLPQRELFSLAQATEIFWTDIVMFPYFLVSEKLKDIITFYEPNTVFKEIVLLEAVKEMCEVYYLPILECIQAPEDVNDINDISFSNDIEWLKSKRCVEMSSIFQLKVRDKTHVVVRLDILESFLRKGAKGIAITQLN